VQTQPPVAIVILNYNGRHHLEKFLPSVIASTYSNKRIIVADNASTDDSIDWLQRTHPSIEMLLLPVNYGFAKGYNKALEVIDSEYYILLNSDVEVSAGWIEPVIELMHSDSSIAACQPKIKSYVEKEMFEYAGACGGWIDALGYPFSRGRIFDTLEADKGQYEMPQKIFWTSGAAMFVRSKVYHALQGLDPFFFAHQEEIDLCWRIQLAGHVVMACPASTVYHVGGGTLAKGQRKAHLNFRNNLIMVAKNWHWQEKWWKIPLRLMLDIVSAYKALLDGDSAFFRGVFFGHMAFFRWMLSSKKQNLFPANKEGKLHGVYKGSIVWQYFIRHKKTFAEIVSPAE
jgi:GT2 family glycosyltransferase